MFETLTKQLGGVQNPEGGTLLLINALIARIASARSNPDEVRALVEGLQAEKNQLARAVVEGTPGDLRPRIADPNDPDAVKKAADFDKKLYDQSVSDTETLRTSTKEGDKSADHEASRGSSTGGGPGAWSAGGSETGNAPALGGSSNVGGSNQPGSGAKGTPNASTSVTTK